MSEMSAPPSFSAFVEQQDRIDKILTIERQGQFVCAQCGCRGVVAITYTNKSGPPCPDCGHPVSDCKDTIKWH